MKVSLFDLSTKHTLQKERKVSMQRTLETKYAKSGDINIAYQEVGAGELDLVVVPGWLSHLDLWWEAVGYPDWIERLASFCRVILFDKRGTGLSDRDVGDSTLEERMDDLRAVLDEAGSQRAAIFGFSEGGPLSILFAATYPERVHALVLCATFARATEALDYSEGAQMRASLDNLMRIVETAWGQGQSSFIFAPSVSAIDTSRNFAGRFERGAASPRAAQKHLSWIYEIDVRPLARTLRVPTLVLHRVGDRAVPVSMGRWLARNIPNASYFEQPGDDHLPWLGDSVELVDKMQLFLTGSHGAAEIDRVLVTVLFTDIVSSTERAATLGDRAWHGLLDRHNEIVRTELARYRGREVNTTGDGFLAVFDGPARAVRCAMSIRDGMRSLGIEIRAGVHTGECERDGDNFAGIAVHTGARIMSQAAAGEVLVSGTVKDLVAGSGLRFRDRGVHSLKGVPGEWILFAAE
jgi:pimeloyl-ACP methyl ester carboxylesterase